MITCPERAQVLEQTLADFRHTDWQIMPHLQMDESRSDDRRGRQTQNARRALEWFMAESDAEFALLMEDDLEFNRHLFWNLERWTPIVNGSLHFGSLYNPNIRRLQEGVCV